MTQTKALWPYALLTLLFVGLALTLVARPGIAPHETLDEASYHQPTVLTFVREWPCLDLNRNALGSVSGRRIEPVLLLRVPATGQSLITNHACTINLVNQVLEDSTRSPGAACLADEEIECQLAIQASF